MPDAAETLLSPSHVCDFSSPHRTHRQAQEQQRAPLATSQHQHIALCTRARAAEPRARRSACRGATSSGRSDGVITLGRILGTARMGGSTLRHTRRIAIRTVARALVRRRRAFKVRNRLCVLGCVGRLVVAAEARVCEGRGIAGVR
jgi:hypothetical protein